MAIVRHIPAGRAHTERVHLLQAMDTSGLLTFERSYIPTTGEDLERVYIVTVSGIRRVLAASEVAAWCIGLVDGMAAAGRRVNLPGGVLPLRENQEGG